MKRNLKRAVSLLLCAVLLVGVMGSTALAASKTSGKCGKNVKWSYNSKTKTLTISGKGKMYDYYRAPHEDRPWRKYLGKIKKIVVKKGVKRVGGYAFASLEKLEKISFPNSLREIGVSAFVFCNNLKTVQIPNGVSIIEDGAFSSCDNLKTVSIPSSVKTIDYGAFEYCTCLTKVTIAKGVKDIGTCAFYGCTKLKKITIPKSVIRIGNGAFGAESTYYDEYNDRLVYYYSEVFCIYGQKNSAAERYAKENGIKFKTA